MSNSAVSFSAPSSVFSHDPRAAVRAARAARFEGLEFDVFAPGFALTDLSATGRRDFRHMLSAGDVRLASMRVEIGNSGFARGADVDRLLARLDTALELSAGLACRLICLEVGPLPAPKEPAPTTKKVTRDEAGMILLPDAEQVRAYSPPAGEQKPFDADLASQVDGALAEVGRLADRYGVTMAMRSELASLGALERALRASGCANFGVDLDGVCVLCDEWTMDEIFSRLGGMVRHVRARDAVLGADRRTRPAAVGEGSVKWEEILTNLRESGYRGWIAIDSVELPDRVGAAAAGLKRLGG